VNDKNHHTNQQRAGPQGTMLFRASDLPDVAHLVDEEAAAASIDKPVLIGTNAPFEGQRFVLNKSRTSVGRRGDNDLVLTESSVSSMHAWLINENGQWRVMNMLSTNGTFVNGEKIHEALLKDGDRVRFGGVEFLFRTREVQPVGKPPIAPVKRIGGLVVVGVILIVVALGLVWWLNR